MALLISPDHCPDTGFFPNTLAPPSENYRAIDASHPKCIPSHRSIVLGPKVYYLDKNVCVSNKKKNIKQCIIV